MERELLEELEEEEAAIASSKPTASTSKKGGLSPKKTKAKNARG